MKIAIVGAGAIGGTLGARLALSGSHQVAALARGATLAALRQHGWRLRSGGKLLQAPAVCSEDARQLGQQDLLIIAVKAPALTGMAAQLAPLIGPKTLIVPAMNGVPWWFCAQVPAFQSARLNSVDPGGAIGAALPYPQVLGCVVHMSCWVPEPGLVEQKVGNGLIVGEPAGGPSLRSQNLVETLQAAGFDAKLSPDIRRDIWYKLWGNMTMNPISAITGATIDRLLADPLVRALCSQAMTEAALVGDRIGCPIDQTPEDRHAVTARLGAFKTSMLQDVEAQRPIELDAIVGAVHEMAQHLHIATPAIDALLGLTRVFAQTRGLYPTTP